MEHSLFDAGLPENTQPLDFADVGFRRHQMPEKHLDSPITTSLLTRLVDLITNAWEASRVFQRVGRDNAREVSVMKYLNLHPEQKYSGISPIIRQYCNVLDFCDSEPRILTAKEYPSWFRLKSSGLTGIMQDLTSASEIYEMEVEAYLDHVRDIVIRPQDQKRLKEKLLFRIRRNTRVLEASSKATMWSNIVERYRRCYGQDLNSKIYREADIEYVPGDGYLVMHVLPKGKVLGSKWSILTYEQLQMLQDAAMARCNVEVALQIGFHNGTDDLTRQYDRIVKWQEKTIHRIGNDGYAIVKGPEAAFKTWLNSLTEGDVLDYTSYERTMDKIRQKEVNLAGTTVCTDELDTIVRDTKSIDDAAELFGLTKLSGHPTVYAQRSAAAVRTEAVPRGVMTPFAIRQMHRMFKHITLSNYINEEARWPPFLCGPAPGTDLERLYRNHVTSLPMGEYPLSDLDAIMFGKFIEYDYSEDYLKFLDDKAICPGAKEMSKFWFGGQSNESRRLLQKVLTLPSIDMKQLVDRLRRGEFHDDELVVELTQKEREFKPEARCFAKLPLSIRLFLVLNEYNLKEHYMKKYMPQLTMAMSNAEEKHRLHAMVKDSAEKKTVKVEGDLARWNLRMRDDILRVLMMELENIFGMPGVFSQVHIFFKKATWVLTDKHVIPDGANPNIPITQWPQSELVWRNCHLGGAEGLAQATWSIFTIAMMYTVVFDMGVAFLMAGQGDNQIFTFTFDLSRGPIKDQLRKLLAYMEIRCRVLNHTVKPEECIDSLTVLTYSKELYVNGCHTLYNLKFASRSFRRDEIDVPSLSKEVSALGATSMACASSIYCTPKAMFWKTFQVLRLFRARSISPNYRPEHTYLKKIMRTKDLRAFVLLLPGSLGGLPLPSWTKFFMKGELDDLSWDVPAVIGLKKCLHLQRDLALVVRGEYSPRNPRLEQLIVDPHSIPLRRTRDLTSLIKDAVAECLPGITKNTWIRQIITSGVKVAGDRLASLLVRTRPFYPQICSDIHALSPAGVRDEMLGRFVMTRTITRITNAPSFSAAILSSNTGILADVLHRYDMAKRVSLARLIAPPFEVCRRLRHLWGDFVEHACIGVYTPFDFKLRYSCMHGPEISVSSRSTASLSRTVGLYPPNFGTRTRAKTTDHGVKITTSSSTVQDLKKLVLIWSELGSHRKLAEALSVISLSRSPWRVDQLAHVMPTRFGGSAAHRHSALDSKGFFTLGSVTVPTHLNLCSDKAGILSGGEVDVPIAFQPFYLTLTNLMQVLTDAEVISNTATIAYHLTDDYEELPCDQVIVDRVTSIRWPVTKGNPLCYVDSIQARFLNTIPDPDTIRHLSLEKLNSTNLIYSYLLSRVSKHAARFHNTSVVNLPIDLLDLKEFNHTPLNSILRAMSWFCAALTIYHVTHSHRPKDETISDSITAYSGFCAALLARSLTHPTNMIGDFVVRQGITLRPGRSGARSAADILRSIIIARAFDALLSREPLLDDATLYLFEDYEKWGPDATQIHAILLQFCALHDRTHLRLPWNIKIRIASARQSIIIRTTPLIQILEIITASSQGFMTENDHLIDPSIKRRIAYVPAEAKVAVRALRDLKPDRRGKTGKITIHDLESRRLVERSYEIAGLHGSSTPSCNCNDDAEARIVESFIQMTMRPYGRYASALTPWLAVLNKNRKHIRGKRVHLVGVGHGAAAAVCLMLGAREVVGTDLKASFPLIAQREGVYLPPEILACGRFENYTWSDCVYTTGGDLLDPRTDVVLADLTIFDIERRWEDTKPLLKKCRSRYLIVRLSECDHILQCAIDNIRPEIIYSTTVCPLQRKTHFLVGRYPETVLTSTNFLNVKLAPHEPGVYSLRWVKPSLDWASDTLRKRGANTEVSSIAEIRLLNRTLQQMDSDVDRHLIIIYRQDLLAFTSEVIRLLESRDTLAWQSIVQGDPEVIRLVGRLISVSGGLLQETLDRLISEAPKTP